MTDGAGSIRTIVLDLNGVYFNIGVDVAKPVLCRMTGCTMDEWNSALSAAGAQDYMGGRITAAEFWRGMSAALHFDMRMARRLQIAVNDAYRPTAGMPELAIRLGKDYRMVAFSGIARELFLHLDLTYRLHGVFDDFLLSYRARCSKDSSSFYRMLLGKIKCRPQECVYVDDKAENLGMAGPLGIRTALFRSVPELRRQLAAGGVRL